MLISKQDAAKPAWQPFNSCFHSLSARTQRGTQSFRKPAWVSVCVSSSIKSFLREGWEEPQVGLVWVFLKPIFTAHEIFEFFCSLEA